jgi:hypothetical protein
VLIENDKHVFPQLRKTFGDGTHLLQTEVKIAIAWLAKVLDTRSRFRSSASIRIAGSAD